MIRSDQRRVWVVEVGIFGRTALFSTEAFTAEFQNGDARRIRAGLEDFPMSIGTSDEIGEDQAVISIDANDVDGFAVGLRDLGWASLWAAGYDIESGPARLWRWLPGTLFDTARLMLDGNIQNVDIGEVDEPLEFTLATSPALLARTLIDSGAVVSGDTWPNRIGYVRDTGIDGAAYPLVIGYPGALPGVLFAGGLTPRVPALLVEDAQSPTPVADASHILVAGHPVGATSVRVYETQVTGPFPFNDRPLLEVEDAVGRVVTVADFVGATSLTHDLGFEFYTAWNDTGGGGLQRTDGTGPIRGLGELLLWILLERTDLQVDVAAMEAEREFLDVIKIDTHVNDGSLVSWEWAVDQLLPLAPVKVITGAGGVYVRLMRYDATPEQRRFFLDADSNEVSRRGRLRSTGWDRVANHIQLSYAPNRQGLHINQRVLTALPDPDDDRQRFDYRCDISRRRLERPGVPGSGVRTLTMQTDHVMQTESADAVLRFKATEVSLPHKKGTYEAPASLEAEISVGDVVLVRDSRVGITEPRVALVDVVTIGGDTTDAELIILADPIRIDRVTR